MRKAIIPLVATAAAQLLVIESIAAAFAFQPKETQLSIAMIPVQADIEQGECIRRDPAPYEPITYHVPLDAMAGKPKDAHEWALVKTYMKGANLK